MRHFLILHCFIGFSPKKGTAKDNVLCRMQPYEVANVHVLPII